MKSPLIVGGVMLALGIAIGWVAKPVVTAGKQETAEQTASAKPVAQAVAKDSAAPAAPLETKRAERDMTPKKPADGVTEEQRAQAKKMQAEVSKMMVRNFRTKMEQHIERLAANLNLSPEQKAALTTWMEAKVKDLEGLDFTKPDSGKDVEGLLGSLTTKALEDQLTPNLSEDQKASLTEFKEKERKGKADAAALKNLSMLQGVVEFREGQRDEVYKLLAEDAEARALAEEEKPDVSRLFTEGMGIQMDPYDLGIQQAMMDAGMRNGPKPGTDPADQKAMAKQLRESIDQRIDARVEKLRPALDDQQLDQYRTELKTKGLGIFGSVLSSMEKSGE